MLSKLLICIVSSSTIAREQIVAHLEGDRYQVQSFNYDDKFGNFLEANKEQIDCLIITQEAQSTDYFAALYQAGILLPTVIALPENTPLPPPDQTNQLYHNAEQYLEFDQLQNINNLIDQAIAQFLHLAPSCALSDRPQGDTNQEDDKSHQAFLLLQQRRLAEKLRERLGYLGIYYKRNPKYFYRNLSPQEQDEFRQQFAADYREIVLSYFHGDTPTNQAIDQFVNQAFFADISVSYILETHMQLMDEFAQQLKLEGRSEEILLDYRLTLIDIVAHLCEMYRRSIPREDLPFELLFRID